MHTVNLYSSMRGPEIFTSVNMVFEQYWFHTLLWKTEEERDYWEGLRLMHGRDVQIKSFWEWHDHVWINQRELRNQGQTLDDMIYMTAFVDRDLHELLAKPHGDQILKNRMAKEEPYVNHTFHPPKEILI